MSLAPESPAATVKSKDWKGRHQRWSWLFSWLSPLLIVGGAVGLTAYFAPIAYAQYQYWQIRQFFRPLTEKDLGGGIEYLSESQTSDRLSSPVAIGKSSDSILLNIAAIDVSVPVMENVDASRQYNYNTALKGGVAQMKGTAGLDSTTGNSFIFGHSSRFIGSGTPYDTVFANLDKLKSGDKIETQRGGDLNVYTVFRSQAIEPDDTSVLAQTNERIITLMTCWPVGTTAKRWIVQARPE